MKTEIRFDTDDLVKELEKAGDEIVKRAAPTAALYGAKVFYQELQAEVPRSVKGHWFSVRGSKKYWFEPGNLLKAMYVGYDKKASKDTLKVYKVGWVHKDAPYGYMVARGTKLETGGVKTPANPFMRRTFQKASAEAVQASADRFFVIAKEVLDGR